MNNSKTSLTLATQIYCQNLNWQSLLLIQKEQNQQLEQLIMEALINSIYSPKYLLLSLVEVLLIIELFLVVKM
jgi:hypothetical protein